MSDDAARADPIPGVRAGEVDSRGPAGPVSRLAKVLTPNFRPDPRAALRDMRVAEPLRTLLTDPRRSAGLTLDDESADDPYADASGNTPCRRFSVLKSAADQAVLLEIPDWLANDGTNVGALDEVRDAFTNRKVRIVANKVQTPSRSLEKTLPKLWRVRANIDVEFVSWRYVTELEEGTQSPVQVFGLEASDASKAQPAAGTGNPVKRVFIGSTGLDLKPYREAARDACLAMDFLPIMMEYFEAMGVGATAGSLTKLDQADVYVGIFAHRYGYIEAGYTVSVTECEFDHAGKRDIPRICFVVDPAFPWPPNTLDFEHHAQMEAFKKKIGTLIRAQFTTVDDFKSRLVPALVPYRK